VETPAAICGASSQGEGFRPAISGICSGSTLRILMLQSATACRRIWQSQAMAAQRQPAVTSKTVTLHKSNQQNSYATMSPQFPRVITFSFSIKLRLLQRGLYYLRAPPTGWSRNVLLNQMKAKAYERSLREGNTQLSAALPTI